MKVEVLQADVTTLEVVFAMHGDEAEHAFAAAVES